MPHNKSFFMKHVCKLVCSLVIITWTQKQFSERSYSFYRIPSHQYAGHWYSFIIHSSACRILEISSANAWTRLWANTRDMSKTMARLGMVRGIPVNPGGQTGRGKRQRRMWSLVSVTVCFKLHLIPHHCPRSLHSAFVEAFLSVKHD